MLNSIVEPYQVRFVKWALPRIPKFIETYHLTLLTIFFSLLMVFAAKNMVGNRYFLLISAGLIFLQYLSDILDGALGRFRDTGLVRWGFYMDHFLDYFFSISTAVSYAIFYQIGLDMTMIVITLVGAYFTHEFIIGNVKGMVNTSGYYGFGPSEARFMGIIASVILFLTNYQLSERMVMIVLLLLIILFSFVVFKTQKSFWIQDMVTKKKNHKIKKK
jgi:phosphatidylglycerophosphate synthase